MKITAAIAQRLEHLYVEPPKQAEKTVRLEA
jgi:hypothetical protein